MFGGRARAPQRRHLAFDAAGKMPALPVFSSVIEAESFPDKIKMKSVARRDGRVAEGARLESVYTFTGIGGSNPSLSARFRRQIIGASQTSTRQSSCSSAGRSAWGHRRKRGPGALHIRYRRSRRGSCPSLCRLPSRHFLSRSEPRNSASRFPIQTSFLS